MVKEILKDVGKELVRIFIPFSNTSKTPKWVLEKRRRDKRRRLWRKHVNHANRKNIGAYQKLMKMSPGRYRKKFAKRARRTWKNYRKYKAEKSELLK